MVYITYSSIQRSMFDIRANESIFKYNHTYWFIEPSVVNISMKYFLTEGSKSLEGSKVKGQRSEVKYYNYIKN